MPSRCCSRATTRASPTASPSNWCAASDSRRDARRWLERELWPRVGQRVAEWKREVDALDPPPPAAVVEVPLLFESGMETAFDATSAVIADEDVRAGRAAARGHASVAERAGRQLSQEEKAQRADYEVRNDGTLEELRENLSRVLARLDPPLR